MYIRILNHKKLLYKHTTCEKHFLLNIKALILQIQEIIVQVKNYSCIFCLLAEMSKEDIHHY